MRRGGPLIPPSPLQPYLKQPALRGFTTVAPSGNHGQTGSPLIPPPHHATPLAPDFFPEGRGVSYLPPTPFADLRPPSRTREAGVSRGIIVGEAISGPRGKQGGGVRVRPPPHGCGNDTPPSCHPPAPDFFAMGGGVIGGSRHIREFYWGGLRHATG